ncbi:hypothetical protein [Paracoccus sp. Ld10]
MPPPDACPRIDVSGCDYADWLNAVAEATCVMVGRGFRALVAQ